MHRACVTAILLLAGCATQQAVELPAAPAAPVVTDNFCETARKRSWSVKDTPKSISEAQAWNRAVDRRCLPPAS